MIHKTAPGDNEHCYLWPSDKYQMKILVPRYYGPRNGVICYTWMLFPIQGRKPHNHLDVFESFSSGPQNTVLSSDSVDGYNSLYQCIFVHCLVP